MISTHNNIYSGVNLNLNLKTHLIEIHKLKRKEERLKQKKI